MGIQLGGVWASPRLEELASYGVGLSRGERGRQELNSACCEQMGPGKVKNFTGDGGQGTALGFSGTEIVN